MKVLTTTKSKIKFTSEFIFNQKTQNWIQQQILKKYVLKKRDV